MRHAGLLFPNVAEGFDKAFNQIAEEYSDNPKFDEFIEKEFENLINKYDEGLINLRCSGCSAGHPELTDR